MRRNYLSVPVLGTCAVATNEGDFVHIGSSVGAEMRNMNYAWMAPMVLEKALADDPDLSGTFSPSGDSMIYVDRNGNRVTNEKLAYNESAQAFFKWDPARSEYPNLVLAAIWDQRSQDHSASHEYGRFIVPKGTDDSHVIKGKTLKDLAANIDKRFRKYASQIGGARLSPDFVANLEATIARFNGFAREGRDRDFHRGERPVELLFNGPAAEQPAAPNPTMYPISDDGPYYAALLTGGSLDTKGGPMTNPKGQVLDRMGKPIPGLYGAGNCVASVSARAYWAGGATLGPIPGLRLSGGPCRPQGEVRVTAERAPTDRKASAVPLQEGIGGSLPQRNRRAQENGRAGFEQEDSRGAAATVARPVRLGPGQRHGHSGHRRRGSRHRRLFEG